MEIGTGIFLASVVLGTVALFIATKDRWSWKKIVARTLLSVVAFVGLVAGGFHLKELAERRPSVDVSLWELTLGQSKGDVRFLKGEPGAVLDASEQSLEQWSYDVSGEGAYNVGFKDERIVFVFYAGNSLYAPDIQGVSSYAKVDAIAEHLGPPEKTKASTDGLRRLLLYPKWRTWFAVRAGGIVAGGIYDPTQWEPGADEGRWTFVEPS